MENAYAVSYAYKIGGYSIKLQALPGSIPSARVNLEAWVPYSDYKIEGKPVAYHPSGVRNGIGDDQTKYSLLELAHIAQALAAFVRLSTKPVILTEAELDAFSRTKGSRMADPQLTPDEIREHCKKLGPLLALAAEPPAEPPPEPDMLIVPADELPPPPADDEAPVGTMTNVPSFPGPPHECLAPPANAAASTDDIGYNIGDDGFMNFD